MKILVVEDEADLLQSIVDYLPSDQYIVETAGDYITGDEKIGLYDYDLVILDITLPHGNGLQLLNKIKEETPGTAVIIISAKDSLEDKLTGLDLGADDYLTKPFHLPELNSRINAILRRRKFGGRTEVRFNEISILPESKEVMVKGKNLELTAREYALLLHFITNKDRVLEKSSIAEHLWGDHMDMADNFDFIYTHINNLRKKIRDAGGNDYIRTVYGMGYKFSEL